MHSLLAPSNDPATHSNPLQLEYFVWLLSRMPCGEMPAFAVSPAVPLTDDMALVQRVMASFNLAQASFRPSTSPWDTALLDIKKTVYDALSGTNAMEAASVLRDPGASTFFWGFDAVASSRTGEFEPHEFVLRRLNGTVDWRTLYVLWVLDALISFAEAIGARRVAYPEIEMEQPSAFKYGVDDIIDELEAALDMELHFPNPYPNEHGLYSKRGVIGFRAVQSVYQAWRIAQLADDNPDFKVLEIGAGLGRTAYFANRFGVKNYTIVDVPLTNAAQGYFLGRVLGADEVQLYGESKDARLKIIPSSAMDGDGNYDLIVNVDSWTELSPDTAQYYWNFARRATHKVLSINHEFNSFTVRDLYSKSPNVKALRFPYCMRRGYVEEILTWKQ